MKIKSIAIEVTDKAFLPESFAYCEYFRKQGFKCDLIKKDSSVILDYDAIVLFHGFHPFWRKYPKFIIGEYHSLSTGKFSRLKDFIKRLINVRSDLYIFLNHKVREKMFFPKTINYVTRSMGYSLSDFNECKNKIFDIVYCGSYRNGLSAELMKLAEMGLTIAVVGPDCIFKHENITSFGRKSSEDAKLIILQAKYGLNYTPNVFPLNIQDSTKIIEYCAAQLGVITNRYQWVNEFELSRNARFLSLDDINKISDIEEFDFVVPDISDLEWSNIMKQSNILDKLSSI